MTMVDINNGVARGVMATSHTVPSGLIPTSTIGSTGVVRGASVRTGRKLRTGETVKYAAVTRT